jgi:hypothetical protein
MLTEVMLMDLTLMGLSLKHLNRAELSTNGMTEGAIKQNRYLAILITLSGQTQARVNAPPSDLGLALAPTLMLAQIYGPAARLPPVVNYLPWPSIARLI